MTAVKGTLAAFVALAVVGCSGGGGGQPVGTANAGGKTVTLSTASGQLTNGDNDFTLTFADASGKPVEVQSPAVRFTMPAMPNMAEMNSDARLESAGQPGVYRGTVDLGMKGAWQTKVSFQDAAGSHQAQFDIQAQ
ncbi:hypothetical protein D3C72_551250 [compost metagenome]